MTKNTQNSTKTRHLLPFSERTRYKHIIWDWNGTLINDVDVCVSSMNFILDKYDKPLIDRDIYRDIFDFPVKKYYEKAGFNFNEYDFSVVGMEFIDKYNEKIQSQKLHENVISLLKFFDSKGIKQSILSAREQAQLENEIKHFKLEQYILKIIGLNNNFAHGKIENGINYLKELDCQKHEIVLVGDTIHDADVAKAMGIDCILISHGHQNTRKLKETNLKIVSNFKE